MSNFDSEMIEFEKELQLQLTQELNKITYEVEVSLKDNIQTQLYDSYQPIYYDRQNEIKQCITKSVDISKLEGIVKFDESKMNHTSAVTGERIGDDVIRFTNYGHHDGGYGKYHDYDGKFYLERTIMDINSKFGENIIELINE